MMENKEQSLHQAAMDMMRNAWIVETVIVALVLVLIGKTFGIAISFYSFCAAMVLAAVIVAVFYAIGRRSPF